MDLKRRAPGFRDHGLTTPVWALLPATVTSREGRALQLFLDRVEDCDIFSPA